MNRLLQNQVEAPLRQSFPPTQTGLLHRRCACGAPGLDGECAACRAKRLASQQQLANPEHSTDTQTPRDFRLAHMGHDFSRVRVYDDPSLHPQSGLSIGQPGDVYEQEANRIADQLVEGLPAAAPGLTYSEAAAPGGVQRLASHISPTPEEAVELGNGQEEEETVPVQPLTRSGSTGGSGAGARSSPMWGQQLAASRQGGQPLSSGVRNEMEGRFKTNFATIRVHEDSEANHLTSQIQARAFTHGAHIYFARDEYRPETNTGRWVLAHELTHVLQQGAAPAAGTSAYATAGSLTSDGTKVQRLATLNQTTPTNLARTNVAPWGPPDPRGNDYRVDTDSGTTVNAWVAYSGYPEALRYWCHGLSLGTYERDMFSVWSGAPMENVVKDEWTSISPASARAGDIAVWLPRYDHSARFTSVSTSGGALDESASRLDTKNGQAPRKNDNLTGIMAVYGSGYGCFRRR